MVVVVWPASLADDQCELIVACTHLFKLVTSMIAFVYRARVLVVEERVTHVAHELVEDDTCRHFHLQQRYEVGCGWIVDMIVT